MNKVNLKIKTCIDTEITFTRIGNMINVTQHEANLNFSTYSELVYTLQGFMNCSSRQIRSFLLMNYSGL